MALLKSKTTANGIVVTYHVIFDQNYCKERDATAVRVVGYVSEEVRRAGVANYVRESEVILRDIPGCPTTAECYAALRLPVIDAEGNETPSFFADAEDG